MNTTNELMNTMIEQEMNEAIAVQRGAEQVLIDWNQAELDYLNTDKAPGYASDLNLMATLEAELTGKQAYDYYVNIRMKCNKESNWEKIISVSALTRATAYLEVMAT